MYWRYQVLDMDPAASNFTNELVLNEWGRAGWELVTISVNGPYQTAYLKRPLDSP